MSNQRVNDMSNKNYNNYSIAKKTIAVVFLSLIGMLNVMAQTGTVTRKFYMKGYNNHPDTCLTTLFINDGSFSGLNLTLSCFDKGVKIKAGLETKNRPNCLTDFINELKFIKEKYIEWSSIAKENGVKKYSKEIGYYKNNPALFLQATKNGFEYYQDMKIAAIHEVHAMFNVDEKGECNVFMGWNGIPFIRAKGYNEGMLTSYPIKETFSVSQVCFNFNSEQQIQSLIDALNLETAKSELLNKTEKDKNLDSLFK